MRSINVPLSDEVIRALACLAERECRRPREQAAYLLSRALEAQDESVKRAALVRGAKQ